MVDNFARRCNQNVPPGKNLTESRGPDIQEYGTQPLRLYGGTAHSFHIAYLRAFDRTFEVLRKDTPSQIECAGTKYLDQMRRTLAYNGENRILLRYHLNYAHTSDYPGTTDWSRASSVLLVPVLILH